MFHLACSQKSHSRSSKEGNRAVCNSHSSRCFWLALFACCVFAANLAHATVVLDPRPEDSTTLFGRAIAMVGDIDADGVPDIAVGAPFQDGDFVETDIGFGKPQNVGKVYVYSGATRQLIRTLDDPDFQKVQEQKFGGQFGTSVGPAGDIDGDGTPDILVGAPHHVNFGGDKQNTFINVGRAFVFSGKDGSMIRAIDDLTPMENAYFGQSVTLVSDANFDGAPDIVVGAPGKSVNGFDKVGVCYIFSGASGAFIRTLDHPFQGSEQKENGAHYGAFSSLASLSGESVPKVVISAPGGGQAFVVNVRTGALLFTLNCPVAEKQHSFGYALSSGLDVNGDNVADIAIGAPLLNNAQGRAFLFNGKDGTLLTQLRSSARQNFARFGASIFLSQDVTGDGKADVLVGAPDQKVNDMVHAGEVFIIDAARGSPLQTLTSETPQTYARFGYALATTSFTGTGPVSKIIGTPFINVQLPDDDGDGELIMHLQLGQIEIQ